MAFLPIGEPVSSATPVFTVDPLPPGAYVFELQVQDNLGQMSAPVQLTVIVFSPTTEPPPPSGQPSNRQPG
jgi:hypothetical protein